MIQPYKDRVYATAVRLLGNSNDAAEITQEAVLRTFWKIRSFHGYAHFYTWLYRTALNLCYRRLSDSHAKIESRSVSLDQPADTEEGTLKGIEVASATSSPSAEAIQQEEIQLVRKALGDLDKSDFQILVLREFEELSYEEIAQRLQLAQGTVMSRLHRARLALAKRLSELGIE